MSGNEASQPKSSHVPGQYLGYSLQCTRFLAVLLEAEPGAVVSLEVIDDVAVVSPDGTVRAVQTKSTADGNPVADRSLELWKTLANWVSAVESGELKVDETHFELHVFQQRTGGFIERMSAASTIPEAKHALEEIRTDLWGEAPAFPKRAEVAQTLAPFVSRVFDAPIEQVAKIVSRVTLTCGSGDATADLMQQMKKQIIAAELLDQALKTALGWVKARIDGLIQQGKPAAILVDDFRTMMVTFARRYDRVHLLDGFAAVPDESTQQKHRSATYVRQLGPIQCDDDDLIAAINDFVRATIVRVDWATRGIVDEGSFDDFEDRLHRHWKSNSKTIAVEHASKDEPSRGRLLFEECMRLKAMLMAAEVPPYFVPGSYHVLADEMEVGWHPDYEAQLEKMDDEGDEEQ